jgi:uncharacterized protein YjbI with pentapeptide repeats
MQRPLAADVEVFNAENEARKTLAEIVGGCILVFGAYQAWLQLDLARQGLEATQEAQNNALKLTAEGQLTERFGTAIEQMGNTRVEVRLGAIYALEQIARTSSRDHWPIMELLTASVRENAPWPDPSSRAKATDPRRADIQAMLRVVGRRELAREAERAARGDRPWWNLRCTNLAGLDLQDVHLGWCDISSASLEGADLARAKLERTKLSGSILARAQLGGATLTLARLDGANLQCADLRGSVLKEATASSADLRGATFGESTVVDGANLAHADLRHASFVGVQPWTEIESLKMANIHGIRSASQEFRDWALKSGAVDVASDTEWIALRKGDSADIGSLRPYRPCWASATPILGAGSIAKD